MDKKELKQITTKVYEEYGFIKKGKYYYLNLETVVICSGFSIMHGVTYLAFNFSIKAIHKEEDRKINNMFDGYDSMEVQMYFNKEADGYHKKEIRYEEWDKDYYLNKLQKLLHYYFDPYKKNAIEHIKKCYQIIGYVHDKEIIILQNSRKLDLPKFKSPTSTDTNITIWI